MASVNQIKADYSSAKNIARDMANCGSAVISDCRSLQSATNDLSNWEGHDSKAYRESVNNLVTAVSKYGEAMKEISQSLLTSLDKQYELEMANAKKGSSLRDYFS